MSFKKFSKAQDASDKKITDTKLENKQVDDEPKTPANDIGPNLPKDK